MQRHITNVPLQDSAHTGTELCFDILYTQQTHFRVSVLTFLQMVGIKGKSVRGNQSFYCLNRKAQVL